MSDYQDAPPMLGVEKEFGRELRYTVIKHSKLSETQIQRLVKFISDEEITLVEAVVVEAGWPEYGKTWEAIKNRTSFGVK